MSRYDYEENYSYPYGNPYEPQRRRRRRPSPPKITMETERKLWKYILFGILTFGIYPTFMIYRMQVDLNIMESRHDGNRTMSYFLAIYLMTITMGIAWFVWWHKFSDRIGKALERRDIDYKFNAGYFWGWNIFGILLFGLGPLIFIHKLCKAMNLISEDFNELG